MKRYQLFAFSAYYPNGGSADVQAEAETLLALHLEYKKAVAERFGGWEMYEILDLQEKRWLTQSEIDKVRSGSFLFFEQEEEI